MSHARQVAIGTVATGLVIAVSLGFISPFSFSMFTGWVSCFLLYLMPIEIVASVTWASRQLQFIGSLRQPVKGLSFVLVCIVIGAMVAPTKFALAGGRIAPSSDADDLHDCVNYYRVLACDHVAWMAFHEGHQEFHRRGARVVAYRLSSELLALPHFIQV